MTSPTLFIIEPKEIVEILVSKCIHIKDNIKTDNFVKVNS